MEIYREKALPPRPSSYGATQVKSVSNSYHRKHHGNSKPTCFVSGCRYLGGTKVSPSNAAAWQQKGTYRSEAFHFPTSALLPHPVLLLLFPVVLLVPKQDQTRSEVSVDSLTPTKTLFSSRTSQAFLHVDYLPTIRGSRVSTKVRNPERRDQHEMTNFTKRSFSTISVALISSS